jgi:hypothetical protein
MDMIKITFNVMAPFFFPSHQKFVRIEKSHKFQKNCAKTHIHGPTMDIVFYVGLWGFYDEELAKNKQEVGRPMSKH